MLRTRNPHPAEFREQIFASANARRSVENLAQEFVPCVAKLGERNGFRRNSCFGFANLFYWRNAGRSLGWLGLRGKLSRASDHYTSGKPQNAEKPRIEDNALENGNWLPIMLGAGTGFQRA